MKVSLFNIKLFHRKQERAVVKETKADGNIFLATEHLTKLVSRLIIIFLSHPPPKSSSKKKFRKQDKVYLESLESIYLSVAKVTKTKMRLNFEIQIRVAVAAMLNTKFLLVTSN